MSQDNYHKCKEYKFYVAVLHNWVMKRYPHYAIQPVIKGHITLRKERWGMDAENCISYCKIKAAAHQNLSATIGCLTPVVCVTDTRRQQSPVFLMDYILTFCTTTSAVNFQSKFPKFPGQTSNLNLCILCCSHLLGSLLYLHVNLLLFLVAAAWIKGNSCFYQTKSD